CPQCGTELWRHGQFFRVAQNLVVCALIAIPRLFCKTCRGTFSLLHEFLAPHKRYVADVQATYVTSYMGSSASYRETAWAEHDGERQDAEASLSRAYRAVNEACELAVELVFEAQRRLVNSDIAVSEKLPEPVQYPNSLRSESHQKHRQLNQLSYLFRLLSHFATRKVEAESEKPAEICAAYRRLALEFRLSTPQSLKQALF